MPFPSLSSPLPPEVILVTAESASTGRQESAFCFADDPDALTRTTNLLVFGDGKGRAGGAERGGGNDGRVPLTGKAVLAIAKKHGLPAAYSSPPSSSSPSSPSASSGPSSPSSPGAAATGTASNLLIFLSGNGETTPSNNFLSLGKKLSLPQTAVLSLLGPAVLPFDLGSAWFQDTDYDTGSPLPWSSPLKRSSLAAAVASLTSLLSSLSSLLPLENVFLFGFSTGATVAMEAAKITRLLGGAACVCGGVAPKREEGGKGAKAGEEGGGGGEGAPVLMITGGADELFPPCAASSARDAYGAGSVKLLTVPGKPHGMIGTERESLAFCSWIAERLARRMPALEKQCT